MELVAVAIIVIAILNMAMCFELGRHQERITDAENKMLDHLADHKETK